MTVHLLRMAVRIESIEHLKQRQAERTAQQRSDELTGELYTFTRNTPRRADEIVDGGSIYWVIKRFIRVRQRILGFDEYTGARGRPRCAIRVAPEWIQTDPHPHKAFRGWRYLPAGDAPPDLDPSRIADGAEDIPPEMADELRDLGLL